MARSSRDVAAQNREAVVQAASRLFRERGCDGVGVPDLMAQAGLTHGAFYRHFDSKAALEAEAYDRGLEEMAEQVWSLIQSHDSAQAASAILFEDYLSNAHRDRPGEGCATAAAVSEAGRRSPGDPLRQAVGAGVGRLADILEGLSAGREGARDVALVQLSTVVGAILLARVTQGLPLSEEILTAARASLAPPLPSGRG